MSFSILDHYNGFVLNNFIKKDISQINLLNKISLIWDQFLRGSHVAFANNRRMNNTH